MPAQSGQCRCVGRAIGAGKAALQGRFRQLCVGEPGACERQHPPALGFVARLGLELAGAHQIIERGQAQGRPRSTQRRAAPARDSRTNRAPRDGA